MCTRSYLLRLNNHKYISPFLILTTSILNQILDNNTRERRRFTVIKTEKKKKRKEKNECAMIHKNIPFPLSKQSPPLPRNSNRPKQILITVDHDFESKRGGKKKKKERREKFSSINFTIVAWLTGVPYPQPCRSYPYVSETFTGHLPETQRTQRGD